MISLSRRGSARDRRRSRVRPARGPRGATRAGTGSAGWRACEPGRRRPHGSVHRPGGSRRSRSVPVSSRPPAPRARRRSLRPAERDRSPDQEGRNSRRAAKAAGRRAGRSRAGHRRRARLGVRCRQVMPYRHEAVRRSGHRRWSPRLRIPDFRAPSHRHPGSTQPPPRGIGSFRSRPRPRRSPGARPGRCLAMH